MLVIVHFKINIAREVSRIVREGYAICGCACEEEEQRGHM